MTVTRFDLRRRLRRARPGAGAILLLPGLSVFGAVSPQKTITVVVLSVTAESVYVDAGRANGITEGLPGEVVRNEEIVARAIVREVSRSSARLELRSAPRDPVEPGDRVRFLVSPGEKADVPASTLRDAPENRRAAGKEFVPLLAPYPGGEGAATRARTMHHGTARLRRSDQWDSLSRNGYSISRVDLNGSLDRIAGSSWAVVYDGNVSYRDGSGFASSPDYRDVRTDVYRAVARREMSRGGFFQAGRFTPMTLAGVGSLDGAQAEAVTSGGFRFGAAAGTRPEGTERRISGDRPSAAVYGTHQERKGSVYSHGTAGILVDLYKGQWDRLAALWDQRFDLASRWRVYSSVEADYRVNGSTVQPQAQVTRLNVSVGWTPVSLLTLRAGVDRSRFLDSRENRDPETDTPFTVPSGGYWRYWVGASHAVTGRLRVSGDASLVDSPDGVSPVTWRLGATRTGLPLAPRGQLMVDAYNINGGGLEGYGGTATAYLYAAGGRLSLAPGVRMRYAALGPRSKEWDVIDYSLRADWRARPLGFFANYRRTFTGVSHADLLELGTDFRW